MIELKNISKIYNKGKSNEQQVLNDLSVTIPDGAYISIMGRSGAGKSTLLHILAGLLPFDEGEYMIGDFKLSSKDSRNSTKMMELRKKYIGIVMQQFALINEYSVYDNIQLPLDLCGLRGKAIRERVAMVLDEMDLKDMRNKPAGSLSGGQKQRVAIARAIVNNPPILLADEPTGSLDEESEIEIMKILKKLNQERGTGIILITHNIQITKDSGQVLLLSNGKIEKMKEKDND